MPIQELWRRLRHLLTRDRIAEDLDEEMRLHLELRTAKNRAAGMTGEEAAVAAKRRFGNRSVLREQGREASGWLFVERLAQDLRYGSRQLRRNHLFTATTVVTLALGIGANAAMFSLLDAALFAPAPVPAANRLVWIAERQPATGRIRGLSYPDYRTIRDARTPFSGVMSYTTAHFSLGGNAPERVGGFIVSGNYFSVLCIQAAAGRTLGPDDDAAPGARAVAVLGDAIWKRRFAGDPAIINRTIVLNGKPFTVVGVLPPGFSGLELADESMDVWVPIAMVDEAMPGNGSLLVEPGSAWLRVIGRLKDDESVSQANAAVGTIELPSRPVKSKSGPLRMTTALPLAGGFDPSNRRELAPILGLLAIVPALVLLIAAANAGNLMLARAIDRRKELALRRSLGASRGRLVRQLLTESVMLALVAGGAGLALAHGFIEAIGAIAQVPPMIVSRLVVDSRVLWATMSAALVTGLAFGVAPALAVTNPALSPALKEGAATITPARGRRRLQTIFVTAQIAVSLLLLVLTGVFLRGVSRATHVDPGFDAARGATISFDLDLQGYAAPRQMTFAHTVIDRASALPGVEAAALTTFLPLGGSFAGTDVQRERAAGSDGEGRQVEALFGSISPRYFDVMGARLVAGRRFDGGDSASAPLVAIVSRALATSLWPGENPVGQRIRIAGTRQAWRTVVGVATDMKDDDITATPRKCFYLPVDQAIQGNLSLVVRAEDPHGVLTAMTDVVRGIDPDLPVVGARTFRDLVAGAVDKQRAVSSIVGSFGAVALFLAVIGMYGVASHSVTVRTREVAIRVALGARPAEVSRMFVWQGLSLSIAGILIGLALSAIGMKTVAALLFGLDVSDAIEFVIAAFVLGAVAVLASYIPARRAANVDPLVALRAE